MELKDIYEAQKRLDGTVHHTPLELSETFSRISGGKVYLKCENLQKTGSFKVRGAFNMISKLDLDDNAKVFSCSAGNHAQGVAYAAARRGVKAVIYMPLSTPIAKIAATEGYGAEVVLCGDVFDDAQAAAKAACDEQHGVFIPPFDHEDIIAGQGTVGLEILNDMPDVQTILVPAGGGGLLAGVAYAVKSLRPDVEVYGVQASGAAAIAKSFGHSPVGLDNIFTIADGIAVKRPGNITMKYINDCADGILTVTDDEIASTIISLIERAKEIVEPAGAAGLAAVLCERYPFLRGKKTVCLLSGGNIDVSFIHKIIERGLVSRGRQVRLSVILSDKPGSLEAVSRILAIHGANVIAIQYDRVNAELSLNETILHITCEVSGVEHGKRVIDALKKAGYKLQ
ncbi:MAG: threonine ammonia-lyase [Clostridiales bacterium]|nr:threonine ammonia-lyase [Clostridiales bacterium]